MSYDKNGNILSLDRFGQEVSGQPIKIDVLTYTYDGNRLLSVADGTNNPDGFNDQNSTGNDYAYDTMGNLKIDKNKNIERINYNHLNLPVEVFFDTGKISYTYDATGTRLAKKVEPKSSAAVTTDYLGGFQYENNDLQFFFQPEGYVKKDENAYLYVFQYKDHLGNVRLSYADCNNDGVIQPASEILEENNYYPFGLKHQGYNELANANRSEQAEKYQYNGKEWNDALGLNIYEMDLRQYDPAIGRWTVQDPVIHHNFSPYSAFDNNPVYWADPSGADAVPITVMDLFNATENGSNASFEFSNGRMISANLAGELASFISEQLQAMYEMQPLEGTEYEGSKGNAYGGGNGGGDPIKKYVSSLDGTKINYLLAENVGIAGSFQIKGGLVVDVYGEITTLTVGVTGRTLAKNVGEINWGATIEIFSGEKLISRHLIQRRNESYLVTTGYDYIGYLQTNFNNISDLNIRVNINYIFNNYGQRAASSTYTKHFYYD